MNRFLKYLLPVVFAAVLVNSCRDDLTEPEYWELPGTAPAPRPVAVTGVTLNVEEGDEIELFEGYDFTALTATVAPENASNKALIWESSDEDVATVSPEGVITGVGEGSATITVTTVEGGFTAECVVNVVPAPTPPVTVAGVTFQISIENGRRLILTTAVKPADAAYGMTLEWKSDNESVATVDDNGLVTTVGEGEATITVTVNGMYTTVYKLTVLPTIDIPAFLNVRKEFRAAWIATAWRLDWPKSINEAAQKQGYIDILDMYRNANFNAVFVQVRGRADPFWDSQWESWSDLITGTRGQKPNYDVMEFLIEETHKRGMEFHAWINPFRISTTANDYVYPSLDPKIDGSLVKDYALWRVYNPALPAVHSLISDIVSELITLYPEIDGIHMDDYFYVDVPNRRATGQSIHPGLDSLDDEDDFALYGAGFPNTDLGRRNWRRDNVTKVIRIIQDIIIAENPRMIFSISPQQNESNNFNNLFADILQWCQNSWIDMVIPQLYNNMPGFQTSLETWALKYAAGTNTPTLAGLPIYRILNQTDGNFAFSSWESMMQLVKADRRIAGEIIYKTDDFVLNRRPVGSTVGTADLMRSYYERPAVRPAVLPSSRMKEPAPIVPQNVALTGDLLEWTALPEGQTAVVYIIPEGRPAEEAYVVSITNENSITVTEKGEYFVTAFNKNNVESALSKSVIF